MVIEKVENVDVEVYVCPLCGSKHDDYDSCVDCIKDCACDRYDPEEKHVKGDIWQCTDCGKEFNSLEDANKHPTNCSLLEAAKHPYQKKIFDMVEK